LIINVSFFKIIITGLHQKSSIMDNIVQNQMSGLMESLFGKFSHTEHNVKKFLSFLFFLYQNTKQNKEQNKQIPNSSKPKQNKTKK